MSVLLAVHAELETAVRKVGHVRRYEKGMPAGEQWLHIHTALMCAENAVGHLADLERELRPAATAANPNEEGRPTTGMAGTRDQDPRRSQ